MRGRREEASLDAKRWQIKRNQSLEGSDSEKDAGAQVTSDLLSSRETKTRTRTRTRRLDDDGVKEKDEAKRRKGRNMETVICDRLKLMGEAHLATSYLHNTSTTQEQVPGPDGC